MELKDKLTDAEFNKLRRLPDIKNISNSCKKRDIIL